MQLLLAGEGDVSAETSLSSVGSSSLSMLKEGRGVPVEEESGHLLLPWASLSRKKN